MSEEWSFNLRSIQANHDSDSDSDDENNAPNNSISEETRLLQDLDISTREESVVYKPNPFSIARINAAARGNQPPKNSVAKHFNKPNDKPLAGAIVDSFKKAEQKKRSSHPTSTKKPLAPSAVTHTTPPLTSKAPTDHSKSVAARAAPRPNSRPDESHDCGPTAPDIASETIASITAAPAHLHVPTPLPSPPPPAVVLKQSMRPPSVSSRPDFSTLTVPSGTIVTTNALKAPAHLSTSSHPAKKFRPPAPISFSSPAKNSTPFASRKPVFLSSPLRPAPISALPVPDSTLAARPKQFPNYSSIHAPIVPHVSPFLSSNPPVHMTNISGTSTAGSHRISRHPRTSHPRQLSPDTNQFGVETHRRSKMLRDTPPERHSNLPPSSPIQSPSPSPPRRSTRIAERPPHTSHIPIKRTHADAYDCIPPDSDEEWSTLPARKRTKGLELDKPKHGIKTSGTFRLPGIASRTKGKLSGMSANSDRRVVTFLPPPLKAGKVEVVVEDAIPRNSGDPPQHSKHLRESPDPSPRNATPKRRRLNNPYPSPTNSGLAPGDTVEETIDAPTLSSSPLPIRSPRHDFPSPPTSDPIPEHHSNATVSVGDVSQKYPQTKSLMRQRKRGANSVWDLLQLPSCGVVRCDQEHISSLELPVILWKGNEQ
ncbi:hypothetical protein R3P38DRAFT_3339462, partial [Favolaschia claudopus]